MLKFMDSKKTPIIIEDGVTIRGASSWEQKYGYKSDMYFLFTEEGGLAHRDYAYMKAAFEIALHKGTLKEYGMELDGKYFQYNVEEAQWEYDHTINPTILNYTILYRDYDTDELGFVRRATFVEAKEVADKNFGRVIYDATHHEVYAHYEPYWD